MIPRAEDSPAFSLEFTSLLAELKFFIFKLASLSSVIFTIAS